MKKILAILLSLIMVFSLAACGGNTEKPSGDEEVNNNQVEQQQEEQIPEASTKTLAYFQKFLSGGEYTMEMKTTAEGMTVVVKTSYKGDATYSESEFDGQKSCVLMKDNFQYIIDHNAKKVMKISALEATVQDIFADEAANYETLAASGTTEYNGKTYDYEEFTVEGETVQYLFDGDELKIMKANVMGTESVVEIISLEKGADSKLFEIPEDYQMISY